MATSGGEEAAAVAPAAGAPAPAGDTTPGWEEVAVRPLLSASYSAFLRDEGVAAAGGLSHREVLGGGRRRRGGCREGMEVVLEGAGPQLPDQPCGSGTPRCRGPDFGAPRPRESKACLAFLPPARASTPYLSFPSEQNFEDDFSGGRGRPGWEYLAGRSRPVRGLPSGLPSIKVKAPMSLHFLSALIPLAWAGAEPQGLNLGLTTQFSNGLRAAVIARARAVCALGIDDFFFSRL